MDRNQEYYASVAQACETVLTQSQTSGAKQRTLSGNDESLPSVIRDLHPSCVYINTNSVGLRMDGRGGGSYWIGWSQNFYDHSLWELETSAEGMRRVLLSRRRLPLPDALLRTNGVR